MKKVHYGLVCFLDEEEQQKMENEYHITVNDSVFRTKCWGLHAVILLIGCFALQFVVYSLLDHMGIIHNHDMEEYMPEIALAVTVFVTCM